MIGRRSGIDEAGFTLIELLVAMVVIAVGVFAVLGALGVGISSGQIQRNTTTAELGLRAFAEHVKGEAYADCPDPADDPFAYGAGFDDGPYPEVTFEVVEVRFWDWDGDPDTLPAPGDPLEFTDYATQCVDDVEPAPGDQGLQQVVLHAGAGVAGSTYETIVVKRR